MLLFLKLLNNIENGVIVWTDNYAGDAISVSAQFGWPSGIYSTSLFKFRLRAVSLYLSN